GVPRGGAGALADPAGRPGGRGARASGGGPPARERPIAPLRYSARPMPLTDAPARPPGHRAAPGPAAVALILGAVAAGVLGVLQPLAGLGLAVVVLIATLLRDVPLGRLAPALVVLTALAAVAGPNLAAPPAPWLFLFRVLIVL